MGKPEIRRFESRTSLRKVFRIARPFLSAEALCAAAPYFVPVILQEISRERQIDSASLEIPTILFFGLLALMFGLIGFLVTRDGLCRHLALAPDGIQLKSLEIEEETLPWDSIRFVCAHAGRMYFSTTEGRRSFPDVLEADPDEILREIQFHLPECAGKSTEDSEPWTDNPEVRKVIEMQRTKFAPGDRLEIQKRPRRHRVGLVAGCVILLMGLLFTWLTLGATVQGALDSNLLVFSFLISLTTAACGLFIILFVRDFGVHDFLLLTPEMLITGTRFPQVVWIQSVTGVGGTDFTNNDRLVVALRDGSSVAIPRFDMEKRLRHLTCCFQDYGAPEGYVHQATAARMLRTNMFSAYNRLDRNKVPHRLKWSGRYYLRADVERLAAAVKEVRST